MLKKLFFVCVIVGLYIATVSLKKQQQITNQEPEPAKKSKVNTLIIDPGHGGLDGGAHGQFSYEKNVALAISLKLGKAIQEAMPDVKIIYTRTTDVLPGNLNNKDQALRYRADLANKSKADLYISIHCDAAGRAPGGWYEKRIVGHKTVTKYVGKGKNRRKKIIKEPIYESFYVENKAKGASTYIWAADRSEKKSENISFEDEGGENVEDSLNILDLNSPEARIRAQLYTKFFFKNSYTMASNVQEEFEKAGRINRGVLQRNNKGIWVLQATGMPSLLIETGYISNTDEEKYLNSEAGQAEIVSNILTALDRYRNGK